MQGWIKSHRKTIENKIWQKDLIAWHVFETLLYISNNGVWEGGRFQLAELAHLKDSTTYKALKRLEKAEMVTLSSNNRFTTISICNWRKYQGSGNSVGNNQVTTKSQQSNTLNRIKELENKEYKEKIYKKEKLELDEKEIAELQDKFPTKSVKSEYESAKDWLASSGRRYKDYLAFFRNWLRRAKDTRTPPKVQPPPKVEPEMSEEQLKKRKQRLAELRKNLVIKKII